MEILLNLVKICGIPLWVSIGPRPFRHGNTLMFTKGGKGRNVSIGPRPFRHGNVLCNRGSVTREMVFQLGHIFSDMEIVHSR